MSCEAGKSFDMTINKFNDRHTGLRVSGASEIAQGLPFLALACLVGTQTYTLISPTLRMALLVFGACCCGLYVLSSWRVLIQNRGLLVGWCVWIAGAEAFNIINSAYPWGFKAAAFRLVCYLLVLCGFAFGLGNNPTREGLAWPSRIPIMFGWVMVAGGVYLYIRDVLLIAAMAAAQRFGGSDMDLHPVGIAYGYGVCVVMAFALLFFDRNWLFRCVNIFMIVWLARGIVSTGSRGVLLAVVAAVGAMAMCALWRARLKERVAFLVILFVLAGGVIVVFRSSDFWREQIQFYISRFQTLEYGEDASANIRLETMRFYGEHFSSWVLTGLRGYSGDYPHNFFYELWLRFGLVGLGFGIGVVYVVFKSFFILWKIGRSPLVWAMWGVMFLGLMNAQFNLALEFNRAFWFGIGGAIVLVIFDRRRHDVQRRRRSQVRERIA